MRVQKIRLKDVAERAGVAVNTASTILNRRPNSWASKETEERVFQAATDLGYRPNRAAQSLRFGRFDSIALLVHDLNDPFCAAMADAMTDAAEARGYDLLIETSRNDDARALRILEELTHRNVDGVAVLARALHAPGGLPLVAIGPAGGAVPGIDTVLVDFAPGLRDAVNALAIAGHRRFAFLNDGSATSLEDLLRRVLTEKEIPSFEMLDCGGEPGCESIGAALRRSAHERPTVVVAQRDLHAASALRAATEAGLRVPRDLSIVTMEDSPLAAQLPVALSAIAQPISSMAERAVELLHSRIENSAVRGHTDQTPFSAEYIPRESTGAAPQ